MLDTNEVRIETCTLCNHKCVFCPHEKYFKRNKDVMSYETFTFLVDKIKNEAPHITELTLSGMGEIFLDPTILKKIDYAYNKGYNVHLLTNGTALEFYHIDFFLNKITDITFSLHSLNAQNWSNITGCPPELHSILLDNIEYILEYERKPRVHITCDIIDINEGEIQEIINYYEDRVYNLEIWKPHNWVDTFNYRNEKNKHLISCGRPERSPIQIQIDGTINMCCFDYNGELLLGDFKKNTLSEIFSSEKFQKLKDIHNSGFTLGYICDKCDQRFKQNDILIYSKLYRPEERVGATSTTLSKVRKNIKVYINAQRDTGKALLRNFLNKHLYLSEIAAFYYKDLKDIIKTDASIVSLIRDPRVCWFVTNHKYDDGNIPLTLDRYLEKWISSYKFIMDEDYQGTCLLKFEDLINDKISTFNRLANYLNIDLVKDDTFEYTDVSPISRYFTRFDLHKIEKYLGRVQQSEFDYISEKTEHILEFFGYEKQLTIFNMMKGALC